MWTGVVDESALGRLQEQCEIISPPPVHRPDAPVPLAQPPTGPPEPAAETAARRHEPIVGPGTEVR